MPTPRDLIEFLLQVPEVRVLQLCAQRCGLRFGLRGGVVRHLLFSFPRLQPQEVSLFDFVDTFSDVDLVVQSEHDWTALEQAISASLPFAGFHRWEVERLDRVLELANSYVLFPIDRVVIWLDGTQPNGQIAIEGLGSDPGAVLSEPTVEPDLESALAFPPERPVDRLLSLLRFARYYYQHPEYRRVYTPTSMLEQLYLTQTSLSPETSEPHEAVLAIRRIELALLHMVFNSRQLEEVWPIVGRVMDLIPERWLDSSQVMKAFIREQQFNRAAFIGAAVYLPGLSRPLRSRMFSRQTLGNTADGNVPSSIIPWTTLSATGEDGETGCCHHRDFRSGPAVVAWRGHRSEVPKLQSDEISRFGVVARSRALGTVQSYQNPGPVVVVPIPGFVQSGPSLTVRLDNAYVRALSGRNIAFQVGVVHTIFSDQESR